MIFYKTNKEDDPYFSTIWKTPQWLDPIKNAKIIKFPKTITNEVTNRCNSRCIFCSRQLMEREEGDMSLSCVEGILKECSKHSAAIRHGGWGETLMHPRIVDIVELSKKYNVLTTIFTNGILLAEENVRSFIKSGLDELRFSTTGMTESEHNYLRRGSNYIKDFAEKVRMVSNLKKEMKSKKPYLTIYKTVINYDETIVKDNINEFVSSYLEMVDKIDIDLTNFHRVRHLDHVKGVSKRQKVLRDNQFCVDLFITSIIHWNGDIFACDEPYNFEEKYYLGNINKGESIENGWNSEKINMLREKLSYSLEYSNDGLCKDCFISTTKWDDKEYWQDKQV